MVNELVHISDFLSIVETVVLLIASYIGSIVHEYFFISGKINFIKNPRIWLTVTMNFIICYSINPYIVEFNPRLILLPPLILGLLGNELAVRMGTLHGSTSFIEYILGFFGIKNKLTKEEKESLGVKEHREIPQPLLVNKEESNQEKPVIEKPIAIEDKQKEQPVIEKKQEKTIIKKPQKSNQANLDIKNNDEIKKINQSAYILLNQLEVLLLDYCNDITPSEYMKQYITIKSHIKKFSTEFKKFDYLPLNTTLKISEILNKEKDLDRIYRQLTSLKSEDVDNE